MDMQGHIDNRLAEIDQGDPDLSSKPEAQAKNSYEWIHTLPIAAVLVTLEDDRVGFVAANALFNVLGSDKAWLASRNLRTIAEKLAEMREKNVSRYFFSWSSPDPVNAKQLDITFGKFEDKFLISIVDRTAEAKFQLSLRREMLSDSLTGFPNRSGFEEEIERALDEIREFDGTSDACSKYGIIAIDLSRFSRVNECVGPLAGDELIITVARRLKSAIRGNDFLARLGGNEFGLFVHLNAGREDLDKIAARIEQALSEPVKLSELEIQLEIALGGAVGEVSSDDPLDTIRYAQIALKRAKSSKMFELYTPEALTIARRRFSMETELRHALHRGDLELNYQPLIDLNTGMLSGFEALARWQNEERGFISPVEFIPVAEDSGLIVPLGRWALNEAATTMAEWDVRLGAELGTKVNVNLSAVQVARDNVPEAVEDALRASSLKGERLTLELTESAIVSDPDRAIRVLESLKNLNTNIAMDDFGTGYSNLAYLQRLPIDVLKIDRSFVTEMLQDKEKVAIVRTVLSLAEALNMKTTAEGVETIELSNTLAALGCSFGQGYYYAKPLSKQDAYSFLKSAKADGTVALTI